MPTTTPPRLRRRFARLATVVDFNLAPLIPGAIAAWLIYKRVRRHWGGGEAPPRHSRSTPTSTVPPRVTRVAKKPQHAPTPGHSREQPRPQRRYPGDYVHRVVAYYSPKPDGKPDPGEIVWTWVPYEDDPHQGKDRPVLLVSRDGEWLLGLMLSSKDHDLDATDEARWGRRWMDIGTGEWDRERRPSEVRLDRVIRVHPQDIRREGAVLDKRIFEQVVAEL